MSAGRVEFWWGTMGSGKSTLALQRRHNLTSVGEAVALWTFGDRSGSGAVTSRVGITAQAQGVDAGEDLTGRLHALTAAEVRQLIVDEAQFATRDQIDALAAWADAEATTVACYGLLTDFTGRLFDGAARLIEVADHLQRLQLDAHCWCGATATHNARLADGAFTLDGPRVVIGDTAASTDQPTEGGGEPQTGRAAEITYRALCRAHHRAGAAGPR